MKAVAGQISEINYSQTLWEVRKIQTYTFSPKDSLLTIDQNQVASQRVA